MSQREFEHFLDSLAFRPPAGWTESIERYRVLLEEKNRQLNLTRLTSPEDFRWKQVADALLGVTALPELASESLRVADVGCGGGVPGLVLALSFPQLRLTEVDSVGKKVRAVEGFIEALGLEARAIQSRARALAREPRHRRGYDVVVARAVARTPALLEECAGLLAPGGALLCYKTPGQVEEEREEVLSLAAQRGLSAMASPSRSLPGGRGERAFWVFRPNR